MTTYFTSDWHIGHANIIKLCDRPFNDVNHMNESIISNYQSIVQPDDTVYFIGDIAWNYQNLPGLLQRLPGHKKLVIGNHDKPFKQVWKLNTDPKDYYKFYLDAGFESLDTRLDITIANQLVHLSHFPYRVDNPEPEYDDRYRAMRPVDDRRFLIHGHQHNKAPFYNGKRQFNVSVEVCNYQPVPISTIANVISNFNTTTIHTSGHTDS